MADERLFSILQVSDLHFGTLLADGDAALPPGLSVLPAMAGQLGHHRRAARDLRRFLIQRREGGEAEVVVVNGDLTANGAVAQFDLARSFLGVGPAHPGFGLSLGLADWVETSVSGNHDQWPGSGRIVGWPTPGLAATFPHAFPFVRRFHPAGGPPITVVMVDSDADVWPMSLDRFYARGRFARQLRQLGGVLPEREAEEIRVMVIHHAIADDTVPVTAAAAAFPRRAAGWRELEIGRGSLLALEQALVDHAIQVVMTGHLHVARLATLTASKGRLTLPVLEARCGTTTQRDVYPGHLLHRTQGPVPLRPLPPNTLVMHELVRRDGALIWKAEVYRRAPGRGFVAATAFVPTSLQSTMLREMPL